MCKICGFFPLVKLHDKKKEIYVLEFVAQGQLYQIPIMNLQVKKSAIVKKRKMEA